VQGTRLVNTILLLAFAAVTGCGESPLKTGDVSGTVTIDGRPLNEVSVLFTPDGPDMSGPPSGAITDDAGRYTLNYSQRQGSSSQSGTGAMIGWHKVTLDDFKMKNEMLPPPGRVPAIYTDLASTPLRVEVKEGSQTIDLKLTK
jgi:hypothetical protein